MECWFEGKFAKTMLPGWQKHPDKITVDQVNTTSSMQEVADLKEGCMQQARELCWNDDFKDLHATHVYDRYNITSQRRAGVERGTEVPIDWAD